MTIAKHQTKRCNDDKGNSVLTRWTSPHSKRWDRLEHDRLATKDDEWAKRLTSHRTDHLKAYEWYIDGSLYGHELLKDAIEISRNRKGGVPVLKGTGFTVAQVLAEIAESSGIASISDDFDLDESVVRRLLNGLSLIFGRPYAR